MVPGSRNPLWGEEFNFSVNELRVKVLIQCFGNLERIGYRKLQIDPLVHHFFRIKSNYL